MASILTELLILFGLLLLNGVFAMAETALISARRTRLEMMADQGQKSALRAMELQADPGIFLSTVQVGITLVGIIAGAASGAGLARELQPWVTMIPWLGQWSPTISMIIVVSVITFLSVVVGELLPKRLAIHAPERWASALAGPMTRLSSLASPIVRLLDFSSDALVRLFGVKPGEEPVMSEEEVRASIIQGHRTGALKSHEKDMLESVLELDELTAADLMTPKPQIVWVNLADSPEDNRNRMIDSGHSYFPVYQGTRDDVQGLISVKELWKNSSPDSLPDIQTLLIKPLFVPESMPAARVIEQFRKNNRHQALVIDEFGAIQGLITMNDMMEAIVGTVPNDPTAEVPSARQLDDGSWLVDGQAEMEDASKATGLPLPASFDDDDYRTLAGFVMHMLGHVPAEGEHFDWQGYKIEVADMDRQRIDKVRVSPPNKSALPTPAAE
ncbi:putative hemolysin [Prosthecobacter fusiformis]|uniref:Putative hemolysin n=1 Tax=Prosthecobacter fusiformis TaxID=48464 RepID=A0A4R7RMF6_9BACT|nr:hemolysin family protein [Prosthecobacter fusiformis]TDU66590.1 putative hemolysin [Prosthecobacter fusiformis]